MSTDGQVSVALTSEEPFHGRLLLSDLRVGHVIFDEARYRAMARLFGVTRNKRPWSR